MNRKMLIIFLLNNAQRVLKLLLGLVEINYKTAIKYLTRLNPFQKKVEIEAVFQQH